MTSNKRLKEIQSTADRLLFSLRQELGLPDAIAEKVQRAAPLFVKDLAGRPSFWIIPVLTTDRLVGFLRLGLQGELLAYGRFGQGGTLSEFPPRYYLSVDRAEKEIHAAFGSQYVRIEPPQLVHDGPVDRIAWLSNATDSNGNPILLFWSFGTFYSRPAGTGVNVGFS